MDRAEDLNYIGSYVRSVGRDIDERCKAASRTYDSLLPVWKAPFELQRSCGCSRRWWKLLCSMRVKHGLSL
jgi:hypothetical protein